MAPVRRGSRGGARVSWLSDLHAELGRAGIRGRTRSRIESELADHLASDPESESRLGSPREVAESFAAELRAPRTRRAAWVSLAALALAGLGLLGTSRAYVAAGGWPNVSGVHGLLVALTGVVILVSCQFAFVAGVLGIARTLRIRRRAQAAPAELRLIQGRMRIALGAAALTSGGLLVHTVLLWGSMPAWWDAVALASATVPLIALAVARGFVASADELTPPGGPAAEGLVADVPDWLGSRTTPVLGRPSLLAGLLGAGVCVAMLIGAAHAESSLLEGMERAVAEAIAFFAGFVLLGRRLGLRP